MAQKDDEILGSGGQDFSAEDLSIPDERDNALDEADFENSFDFSDEDVLMADAEIVGNDADQDDSAYYENDSEAHAHDPEEALDEQLAQYDEVDDDHSVTDEPDQTNQSSTSLGWKAWTGLAVVAIAVAGGLGVMVWPDSPKQPPLASSPPIQSMQAPGNSAQASSAPVNVQAFPGTDQGAAEGMPSSNVTGMSFDNGDSGMNASVPAIPDPSDERQLPDEPTYLAALEEDRVAFKAVSDLADKNLFRLEQMRKRFDNYSSRTNSELEDLDRRVSALENGMAVANKSEPGTSMTPPKTSSQTDAKPQRTSAIKAAKPSNDDQEFTYKVPKTPGEIKELQRLLRDFGYRPGKVDGILGGQTRWAIKRLQQEHGLPVDGWLSAETMLALQNPKRYSGTYPEASKAKVAQTSKPKAQVVAMASPTGKTFQWFVRGVTPSKAVVYRQDGLSYAVSVGSEIPGMGQVIELDPAKHEVRTAQGTIGKR